MQSPETTTPTTAPTTALQQKLRAQKGVPSADFVVRACRSADAEELEYCDGYIESAALHWKSVSACRSEAQADRSFCAGVSAAAKRSSEIAKSCRDCEWPDFRPDLRDEAVRRRLFTQRVQGFRDEMKTALGPCSQPEHDQFYCAGYNAAAENFAASYAGTYPADASAGDRARGAAVSDMFVELSASKEFHELRPCVSRDADLRQIMEALLAFVGENPEQVHDSTGIAVLGKALHYKRCPGVPPDVRPHAEQCTWWTNVGGELSIWNSCDRPVSLQFMTEGDQTATRRELKPGEAFRRDLRGGKSGVEPWMFATCPLGYVASLPFALENWEAIRTSHYDCVRK